MDQIFSIGLSKTGNSSLAKALDYLGYKTATWNDYLDVIDELNQGSISTLLQRFDAVIDCFAVVMHYETLFEKYPDAKFILTTRNENDWLQSIESHFERSSGYGECALNFQNDPISKLMLCGRLSMYGSFGFSRTKMKHRFRKHHRNARMFFRGCDRFAELDICNGDAWGQLCSFLGHPVPKISFPHENKKPF
jgi:hypothetical protein